MSTFKTWKVTFTAELATTYDLTGSGTTIIHEALVEAIRKNAGYTGYLVAKEGTTIEQEKE